MLNPANFISLPEDHDARVFPKTFPAENEKQKIYADFGTFEVKTNEQNVNNSAVADADT